MRWQLSIVECSICRDNKQKGYAMQRGHHVRGHAGRSWHEGPWGISNGPMERENTSSLLPHRNVKIRVRLSFSFYSYSTHLPKTISFLGAQMLCIMVPRTNVGGLVLLVAPGIQNQSTYIVYPIFQNQILHISSFLSL